MTPPVLWQDRRLRLLDQRELPGRILFLDCTDAPSVASAIREMVVRGAPAIGIAAAYGMALGALGSPSGGPAALLEDLRRDARLLKAARPTAVNLAWAVERLLGRASALASDGRGAPEIREALIAEAQTVHREEVEACRSIGRHGLELVPPGARILTHCNAGGLATGGYGTALGVVRAAHEAGRLVMVYADETRPYLQGARLTAFELHEEAIPVTVLCDDMAGWLLARGAVDLVVVGADRIAADGSVANKIGTYALAVLARHHGVPFYVAAPRSTFDLTLPGGSEIPIEMRSEDEVALLAGRRIVPQGVPVLHPAFDVTPPQLIDALITEVGLVRPVGPDSVSAVVGRGAS